MKAKMTGGFNFSKATNKFSQPKKGGQIRLQTNPRDDKQQEM